MSLTRPGELSRIQEIAKGDPYRAEVLTLLAVLNERSERQERITTAHSTWQVEHDKKDEIRFERGDARMKALEESIDGKGGVRSGVNDYNDTRTQIKGIRNFIIGLVLVIGTAYGAIKGIGEIISYWASLGKHP